MRWGGSTQRRAFVTLALVMTAVTGAWLPAAAGASGRDAGAHAAAAGAAATGGSSTAAGHSAGAARSATIARLLAAAGPVSPAPKVLDDLPVGSRLSALERALDSPLGARALSSLPTARETAAYAAGSVAVGVIFLESSGASMKSTEDWSRRDKRWPGEDRRELVVAQIESALDYWNGCSPDGSLELFMPAEGTYGAPRTIKTSYEPINLLLTYGYRGRRRVCTDAAWRWQVMKKLGFRSDPRDDKPMPETAYAQKLRRKTGADWAFVVYVVDSLRDRDGMFRGGAVAYTADLFGPYITLTYDNDGYGFANFGAVLAHEIGHIFGALDEYAPPVSGYPSTGRLTSGYLGVRNDNAVRGGTTDYPCIMLGSNDTIMAFANGELCPSSAGQAGFRDRDEDTLPDVVDTRPRLTAGTPVAGTDGGYTVTGTVRERPCPRGYISLRTYFRHDISILIPRELWYRIDRGDWREVTPTDGAFNEPSEGWTLTTGPLAAGEHVLEVEATTGERASLSVTLQASLGARSARD